MHELNVMNILVGTVESKWVSLLLHNVQSQAWI